MATDCTLDADRNLKNACDIEFFNSETDSHPIRRHGTNVEPEKRDKTGTCSFFAQIQFTILIFFPGQRARRNVKGTKMAQYLTEELLDSEGEPVKKVCAAIKKCPQARKSNKKVKHNVDLGPADDTKSSDDGDFHLGSSESDSSADNKPLTNAEVCPLCVTNYVVH